MRARGEGPGPSRRPNLLGPTEAKGLLDMDSGCCPRGVPAAPLLCAGDGCSDADPGRNRGCHGDPAASGLLLSSVTLRALMSSYDEPAPSAQPILNLSRDNYNIACKNRSNRQVCT